MIEIIFAMFLLILAHNVHQSLYKHQIFKQIFNNIFFSNVNKILIKKITYIPLINLQIKSVFNHMPHYTLI